MYLSMTISQRRPDLGSRTVGITMGHTFSFAQISNSTWQGNFRVRVLLWKGQQFEFYGQWFCLCHTAWEGSSGLQAYEIFTLVTLFRTGGYGRTRGCSTMTCLLHSQTPPQTRNGTPESLPPETKTFYDGPPTLGSTRGPPRPSLSSYQMLCQFLIYSFFVSRVEIIKSWAINSRQGCDTNGKAFSPDRPLHSTPIDIPTPWNSWLSRSNQLRQGTWKRPTSSI